MKKILLSVLLCALAALFACTPASPAQTGAEATCSDGETIASPDTSETASPSVTDKDTADTADQTEIQTGTQPGDVTEVLTGPATEPATEPVMQATDAPAVKGYVITEPGVAVVYGECTVDSVIAAKTTGYGVEALSDGKYFAVPVKLSEKGGTDVYVTAKAPGMEESEASSVRIKNRTVDDTGIVATLGSRMIQKKVLPDLYGTNKFTVKELRTIADAASYRVRKATEAAGKDVDIIYVIAPDPMTVYPEEMTDEMKASVKEQSARLKQTVAALSDVEGVTVIDLTQTMTDNKSNGKIYYKLDSHWTQLGAFYAYTHIMQTLGIEPRPVSDYEIVYKDIDDTDINVYSGVGTGEMFESAPFLHALFEERAPYGKNREDTARIWSFANEYFVGKVSDVKTDEEGLTALLLFDSYGFNLIPYLSEHYGRFVTQPAWEYSVDYSLVRKIKPDHIIEILAERDLSELLSAT